MFSRQKKFYEKKMFYMILAVCVFSFGLWMNHSFDRPDTKTAMKQTLSKEQEQPKQKKEAQITDFQTIDSLPEPLPATGNDSAILKDDIVIPDQTAEPPYYFIQSQGGWIQIFHYNQHGTGKLVRTTAISFSLLSDVDQELLTDGIVLHTEEQLLEFLQDFES